MDELGISRQECVARMMGALQGAQAAGGTTAVKEMLKWLGGRAKPEAILQDIDQDQKRLLLQSIRETRIRNKRQSMELARLAEIIEAELK